MVWTTLSITLLRTGKHGLSVKWSMMPDSARHARLLIMPTLSSKLPHSNFAQDVEEQMEFGNLDNWVSQELQHFGPFIGQRGENVHLCPSSFWSCGIFCMQYTCNHPYMLFVFPGQKQAKKRTTLLRECVKNSSLNTAGRSCNSCRRHMISSQYIYIYTVYHTMQVLGSTQHRQRSTSAAPANPSGPGRAWEW